MNWVKALLLLSCLIVGYADLVTTNVILNHGLGELNPFMRLAQTWLGAWWLIPKLSLTFAVMWLLSRSNNLYKISLVVALCSTPVLKADLATTNMIIRSGAYRFHRTNYCFNPSALAPSRVDMRLN